MDIKLLLVKAISLIYRESQLNDHTGEGRLLVKQALAQLKSPNQPTAGDFSHDSIQALKDTVAWMLKTSDEYKFNYDELYQRLRVNTQGEEALFEGLVSGIIGKPELDDLVELVRGQMDTIRVYLNSIKIQELCKIAYLDSNFKANEMDWGLFTKKLTEELIIIETSVSSSNDPSKKPYVIDTIDLGSKEQVGKIVSEARLELSTDGLIRTGWQGLNRMLGDETGVTGCLKRTDFLLLSALQHNYKSGTSLALFRHHALYNKPQMLDPTKKPMLVRMSFETSARYDINSLYKNLYENEYKVAADISSTSIEEISDFISTRMTANGYSIKLMHINPTEFTVFNMFEILNGLIHEGYELHQLNLDYLNMINKRGCAGTGPTGTDIRELFRRLRNYTSERSILTITPHQMATDAKMLIRENMPESDFVNKVANRGYYDGCKGLDQEVDVEIYQHIVRVNGESYITIRRGKHRQVAITPEKDLFCVYKMDPIADIPDDINSKDMSRRTVGGNTNADGGAPAWFDDAA